MSSQTRYVTVETLISMVINTALSVGFVFLVFHGHPRISASGVHGIVPDMAPQTFMVLLMSCLVPGLLTRRRIAGGSLSWHKAATASSPSAIVLRGAILALLGTAVAVAMCWAVLPPLLPMGASFGSLVVAKALYGMLLAAVATPWAIGRVLR